MKIAVVGLGYVGFPLTIRLSQLGHKVLGIDKDIKKINELQKGLLPFAQEEPYLESYFVKEYKRGKMIFSSNFEGISEKDLIIICVDTPIVNKTPNYTSLTNALKSAAVNIKNGAIIIVESTISPKTSENLVIPTIEKYSNSKLNKGFFVAAVPERIRPNHIFEQLTTLSRVIGLSDFKIKKILKKIYTQITSGDIDFTDLTTAETVKTVENSLRDVNIAFANEIAMACEELGVDVWKVRELVNKSPFHNMLQPGAGVGGHCIPKDPWLLVSSVKKHHLSLIVNARRINDDMPNHLALLIKTSLKEKKINFKNATVAIFGYSFLENSSDTRNSPTKALIKILNKYEIGYKVYDPLVKEYSRGSMYVTARNADILLLMVAHDKFKKLNFNTLSKIMKSKMLIDGRNFYNKNKVKEKGFEYKGVGNIIV